MLVETPKYPLILNATVSEDIWRFRQERSVSEGILEFETGKQEESSNKTKENRKILNKTKENRKELRTKQKTKTDQSVSEGILEFFFFFKFFLGFFGGQGTGLVGHADCGGGDLPRGGRTSAPPLGRGIVASCVSSKPSTPPLGRGIFASGPGVVTAVPYRGVHRTVRIDLTAGLSATVGSYASPRSRSGSPLARRRSAATAWRAFGRPQP